MARAWARRRPVRVVERGARHGPEPCPARDRRAGGRDEPRHRLPAAAQRGRCQGVQHHARLVSILADPELETLFGIKPIAGDLRCAELAEGVALTEDGANRLFGTTRVVGRPVTISTTVEGAGGKAEAALITLTVMAVIPSPNLNSTLIYDAIAGFQVPAPRPWWTATKAGTGPTATCTRACSRVPQRRRSASWPSACWSNNPAQGPAGRLPEGWRLGGPRCAGGGADIGLHGAGSGDRRLRLGGLATAAGGVLALAVINFVNLWSVRTLRQPARDRTAQVARRRCAEPGPAVLRRGAGRGGPRGAARPAARLVGRACGVGADAAQL